MRDIFTKFARSTSTAMGNPVAFIGAVALVVCWLISGPYRDWSVSHSMFINTITTIITFLMVFLIQATQNRDSQALHLKLDELILVIKAADNQIIKIEEGTEDKLHEFQKKIEQAVDTAGRLD